MSPRLIPLLSLSNLVRFAVVPAVARTCGCAHRVPALLRVRAQGLSAHAPGCELAHVGRALHNASARARCAPRIAATPVSRACAPWPHPVVVPLASLLLMPATAHCFCCRQLLLLLAIACYYWPLMLMLARAGCRCLCCLLLLLPLSCCRTLGVAAATVRRCRRPCPSRSRFAVAAATAGHGHGRAVCEYEHPVCV